MPSMKTTLWIGMTAIVVMIFLVFAIVGGIGIKEVVGAAAQKSSEDIYQLPKSVLDEQAPKTNCADNDGVCNPSCTILNDNDCSP